MANNSYGKTRYRGLEKNAAQVNMLVGLANLFMLRGRLMAA
jgi:IS5 family transposase